MDISSLPTRTYLAAPFQTSLLTLCPGLPPFLESWMQSHHNHLFLCLQRTMISRSDSQWTLLYEERLGAERLLFYVYVVKPELEAVSGAGSTWNLNCGRKPGYPVACCGLFARLSCRQRLFWHHNADLWLLSPTSKSPVTHRFLPLASLQPQVSHVMRAFLLPFSGVWDTLL